MICTIVLFMQKLLKIIKIALYKQVVISNEN